MLRECLGHVMPEWDGARVEVIDRPRLEPPPAASNRACVYVVRRPGDGAFYVGETDRLLERFREHKTVGGVGTCCARLCMTNDI